jgi:hypothetical protein
MIGNRLHTRYDFQMTTRRMGIIDIRSNVRETASCFASAANVQRLARACSGLDPMTK